ncbi:MAG: glycosyl transferase family 28 [Sphingobacteriaceae bacterium]|nr:MAG: glycosyl transferase family 28 [Sphingobacteriaceae bacterium]
MIFVTTGTQEPFDRLIEAVDELAGKLPGVTFNVQAFTSEYKATNINVQNFITPVEFDFNMRHAKLIISHAGMGTIISALVNSKPIIVMPRLLKYHEHRNEHQLATAKKLDDLGYILVAYNEQDLVDKVLEIWPDDLKCLHNVGNVASQKLLNSLNNFINQ